MGNIRLYLKANEKIFINGAVLKVDRKVSFELLNDVTFLLEGHVMQKEDADTPFKQLYFVIQMMLMHPENAEQTEMVFKKMIGNLLETVETPDLLKGAKQVDVEVLSGKPFAALKAVRELILIEDKVLNSDAKGAPIELVATKGPADQASVLQKKAG